MAQPKRKSPEKRQVKKKAPSLASRILAGAAGAIASHPRLIGGVASFGVVFSFVAANALWYQPKHHPAPLLATRMFENEAEKLAGRSTPGDGDAVDTDPHVTTFRIERQSDVETKAADNATRASVKPVASPLVKDIQLALASRGLYDGPADGLTGPRTTSAILFYQETEGLELTGEASPALLKKIRTRNTAVAVISDERPSQDITASTKSSTGTKSSSNNGDDVAALIRESDSKPKAHDRKNVSTGAVQDGGDSQVPVEIVMKIQKALSGLAYANVKVDGVAGSATRAAIRAFEKSYRLPVTGEPSERVLKKLKSIGAIR